MITLSDADVNFIQQFNNKLVDDDYLSEILNNNDDMSLDELLRKHGDKVTIKDLWVMSAKTSAIMTMILLGALDKNNTEQNVNKNITEECLEKIFSLFD